MKKIKIEELGCFNEVASVIGVAEAKRELFRVVNSGKTVINDTSLTLGCAFNWHTSPQYSRFWCDIFIRSIHS